MIDLLDVIKERTATIRIALRDHTKQENGCWIANRTSNGGGYALVKVKYKGKSRRIGLHRLSWVLKNKRNIPEDKIIRHTCHTPNCVRPSHLLLGDHQDNVDDMVAAGRAAWQQEAWQEHRKEQQKNNELKTKQITEARKKKQQAEIERLERLILKRD